MVRSVLLAFLSLFIASCGGGGSGNASNIPVVNFPPVFVGTNIFDVLEGQQLNLILNFSDAEGGSISSSITGGIDLDKVEISPSGSIQFKVLPDYENPNDEGQDNSYHFIVTATDGSNVTDQSITINLINALEARVVDGPVSGSLVYLDSNGDSVASGNEFLTTSDSQGFFSLRAPDITCLALEICDVTLLAVGGIDIATNNDLGELILSGRSLFDEEFSITPLSTILVNATDPGSVLSSFGFDRTEAEIISMDPWLLTQNEDSEGDQLLRVNQQLLNLMMTAHSLINGDSLGSSTDVNPALAIVLLDQVQNSDLGLDLSDAQVLSSLLSNVALALNVTIPDQAAEIIGVRLGMLNKILMSPEINPTAEAASAVISRSQVELQSAVRELRVGLISSEEFDGLTSSATLFSGVSVFESLPDLDGDGLADVVDQDDDGDNVLDSEDAFPRNSEESTDNDGDNIGDNEDVDDDNDGVEDGRDPFPFDSNLTPPTTIFSADEVAGFVPLIVNFDAVESIVGSGDIDDVVYEWSFDDGTRGYGQQVEHIYSSDGEFLAELTVVNSDGLSDVANVLISVSHSGITYSVSGSITVSESMAVDSDVNNTDSLATSNNSINTAQLIPNPVTLAGYVNTVGVGVEGASKDSGDVDDVYAVNALGGEIINLNMSDPDQTDLDVYIYNGVGDQIDFSIGVSQFEVIKLPDEAGLYYINVTVWDTGASTYILTVGQDAGQSNQSWTASADFVIGDIIVQHKPTKLRSLNPFMVEQKTIARVRRSGDSGLMLYSYHDLASDKSTVNNLRSNTGQPLSEIELKAATLRKVKAIGKQGGVQYAEPNYIYRHMATTPNDPRYASQWHYSKIGLPAAWDVSVGNSEIKVAVLDTGVFSQHPDLVGRMSIDDYDFIDDVDNSGDGDGMDADGSDPGDGRDNDLCPNSDSARSSFHGTHVAGTIGAESNNDIDVAGVTWLGEIMNLRVLGCEGGYSYDIANAIRYAAGLENSSDVIVDDPADIINMSLGGGGSNDTMQQAIMDARNQGVIIIAAAGNSSSSQAFYPAAYEGVVSVSATTVQDDLAYYSNFGSAVDISAPGGEYGDVDGDGYQDLVLSTLGTIEDGVILPTIGAYQGTSMASPHMAGVVSLMMSIYPELTPDDLDALIVSGNISIDLGDPGRDDNFGHGRIDALKAVNYAHLLSNGTPIPETPILQLTASYLNFGRLLSTTQVSAYNSGNGNLWVTDVQASESFITVTAPDSVDGLGSYGITVDRTEMEVGIYGATIIFSSNGGDIALDMRLEVVAEDDLTTGNAGLIYTILYNVADDTVVNSTVSSATDGEYLFSLSSTGGVYRLLAGSDLDNDGFICGPSEACGIYPLVDSPTNLILNENLADKNFGLTFVIPSGSDSGNSRMLKVR
ncbi:S8 family serine peptidase [bacterium]|nr:S8 family serine peptidase [bacterium]